MNEPTPSEVTRCLEVRKKSRRGESYDHEGHSFCMEMYKKYPEWYRATERDVFNATVPLGSNVTWEMLHPDDDSESSTEDGDDRGGVFDE